MSTFLEVDCKDVRTTLQNDQIVITITTKIKVDHLGLTQPDLLFLNQHVLKQKEELYRTLFKSKVITPPQPQQSGSCEGNSRQKQNRTQNEPRLASIFQNARSQERQQQPSQQRRNNIFSSNNGFGRSQSTANQNSWRNGIFKSQNNISSQQNQSQSSSFQSNPAIFNPTSSSSNMFMISTQQQPSLFSQSQTNQQSVTNSKRGAVTRRRNPSKIV